MRFLEFKQPLREMEARIQHAEDLIFFQGSAGASRAIEALRSMTGDNHKAVTLKWDGSPAIVFGRDENGTFVFTDKGGFMKKGGVERATSPKEINSVLLGRSGGKHKDDPNRIAFAKNMANIFSMYEKATPKNYRGFFKGDLLYYQTPQIKENYYIFKPQIVQYAVYKDSELGKRIGQSVTGIVIHREVDASGNEGPFKNIDIFQDQTTVLVVPSITTTQPVKINTGVLDQLQLMVKKNAARIDKLLDPNTLTQKQMKGFPELLYAYMNSKVDSGLTNLGSDFIPWLENREQVSAKMKTKVNEYIQENSSAFMSLWNVVSSIMKTKDDIINKFDSQESPIKQSINGKPGGEGYVMAHPKGDIKLVPRSTFSAANRSATR
jgi:hypothetical protein